MERWMIQEIVPSFIGAIIGLVVVIAIVYLGESIGDDEDA